MIRTISEKQLLLSGFKTPFEISLDEDNRWVNRIILHFDFGDPSEVSDYFTL